MGSGSSLVAAARLERRYVGYDLDPAYVDAARARVAATTTRSVDSPADDLGSEGTAGLTAHRLAERVLTDAGFTITAEEQRLRRTGCRVDFVAADAHGDAWYFDVAGDHTSVRGGMHQMDTVWRAIGRATTARRAIGGAPYVICSPALPRRPGDGDTALRAAGSATIFDAIDLRCTDAVDRLKHYAKGTMTSAPRPGFWSPDELA
jgi:site-specific DNA-methyltransferase (adenine-specific)